MEPTKYRWILKRKKKIEKQAMLQIAKKERGSRKPSFRVQNNKISLFIENDSSQEEVLVLEDISRSKGMNSQQVVGLLV